MKCPQCGSILSASDQFCPDCGYSGARDFARPEVQTAPLSARQQPARQQPARQQREGFPTSAPSLKPRKKTLGRVTVTTLTLTLALLAAWFWLRPDQPGWQEKLQSRWQKARIALAPTPENCGAMAPDECRWVAEASRILRGSLTIEKRAGESPAARLTRLSAQISAAKADYLQLPGVPPRCFAAKSLLSRALAEARISVTLAKRALGETSPAQTVKSANQHRQNAATLYQACAGELERLFNSPN